MRATSAVTTRFLLNTSRRRCWPARPLRRAPSSTPRSRWMPSPTSPRIPDDRAVLSMSAVMSASTSAEVRNLASARTPHILARGVALDFAHSGQRQRVLADIDLAIPKGSFVSLIGPSGCGKSTLLKVIAGLLRPAEGEVSVAGLAPQEAARQRMIGLVFQDATLLPWKNALENAAFLQMSGENAAPREAAMARAREMLRLVGLEGAEAKRP